MSTTDEIRIEGAYTDARVFTDDLEDDCREQIQAMVDHEAFREPVRIMPDAHPGAGAVIGFTMPLGERVCPNTVGVDIGCGMTARRLGRPATLIDSLGDEHAMREIDDRIRAAVPMGQNTFDDVATDQDYHLVDDFPWDRCEKKLQTLNETLGTAIDADYGKAYFLDLCDRIGYDVRRAISSLGTLGGGNHFVEVSRSRETDDVWVVVHSGSRGIGYTIAEYWQEQAHRACDDRAGRIRKRLRSDPDIEPAFYAFDLDAVDDRDLLNWVQGGMGADWKRPDAVRAAKEGSAIEATMDRLRDIATIAREETDGDDLDYLEGDQRHGYLRDMIFAQTYAAESRRRMVDAVVDVLDAPAASDDDYIVSTHNYIDAEDLIVRKGATRAHAGERGIVPFNMRDGAVIIEGRGNEAWNLSAPHGAGRRGSRRWAHREFDLAAFEAAMDGVFSTSIRESTIDEAPMAYKDSDAILDRMTPTARVIDELTPVLNLKAT
ncbi:RtcB family protein [Halococcoides cellulosivorans]|uniref:tRNA-splicing ligase RtcB n=1 Tax=Halococcoides cellulosivorans TaxID=1679096 RepID=A0A2R4X240_9EURY|nr:RtcB family protein [Halococcoides cellulosivorans]AWB27793.1 RNA-splicing ligase RtcB [Halococcoides cellulosivorans]